MFNRFVWLLLLFLASPLLAESSLSWRDKFVRERRAAFGDVSDRSSEEVKNYYWLAGENRCAVAQKVDSALLVDAPAQASDISLRAHASLSSSVPTPGSRQRPVRRRSESSLKELQSKARRAYENGRLEEARRFYSLLNQAQPDSVEAAERLAIIDKELQ